MNWWRQGLMEPQDNVFAIEAETMASLDRQSFFLVASSVEIEATEEVP